MAKKPSKFICLIVALVLVFAVLGAGVLSGCDTTMDSALTQHRVTARQALQEYVDDLDKDAYTDEGWVAILRYAESGAAAIDAAADKAAADAALAAAKQAIGAVKTIEQLYQRHPMSDPSICPRLENRIRRAFVNRYPSGVRNFYNIAVTHYFDTFSGVSAFTLVPNNTLAISLITIGGVDFNVRSGLPLHMFNEEHIYDFRISWEGRNVQQLYDEGRITAETLEIIAERYHALFPN